MRFRTLLLVWLIALAGSLTAAADPLLLGTGAVPPGRPNAPGMHAATTIETRIATAPAGKDRKCIAAILPQPG